MTDEQKERFYVLARADGNREQGAYNSGSGTDCAEAPFYQFRRAFWIAMTNGATFEAAWARFDASWRAYAEQNNRKVSDAPKIKRGPRSGQSSIDHRWVSLDKPDSCLPFVRTMVQQILGA